MNNSIIAKKIDITGLVQGVGFRPFLFQLAHEHGLKGEVLNTSQGVSAVVEGCFDSLNSFCKDIYTKTPPLAYIMDIQSDDMPIQGYKGFIISKSTTKKNSSSALISPDVCVCQNCIDEMKNPENRRFAYPFINCTNCGPRYTIIKNIPYDRSKTSMNVFTMCQDCQKEYNDPLDRRFHAQPNACHVCGPHVFLVDNQGKTIANDIAEIGKHLVIEKATKLLKKGYILAVKGLGGFHLAVDAYNHNAVASLRSRKKRPDKPFALMVQSVQAALEFVHISSQEKDLLESNARPIVLLKKRLNQKKSNLAPDISPNNSHIGIMLPYTPLHYLLLEKGSPTLVMTSGNKNGYPLSIDNKDAMDSFSHIADFFLFHNRDIYFRVDDSIVQVQNKTSSFLRRSRGYAPLPVVLTKDIPSILACGGGLKSTICLTKNNKAFLSQHIGDLNNEQVFLFYKNSIEHLRRILDIEPEIIAHDLHPGYMSTSYANQMQETLGIKNIAVQHHHAHAVSCMAENGIDEEVIAITLDGPGLGTDGKIWGGEVMTCTTRSFERKVHLEYIPMPGGEAAIIEPWRMACAYLFSAFGEDFLEIGIPFIKDIGQVKLLFISEMIKKNINSPLTSSCGRFFDAVASIIGIRHKISFESQSAMELQAQSEKSADFGYNFEFKKTKNNDGKTITKINVMPSIKQIVQDLNNKIDKSVIGKKFHSTVIDIFTKAAVEVSQDTGIQKTVLSGGVFNNTIILEGIVQRLEQKKITVYTHTKVPCGDGGISLGQAVVAGAMKKNEKRH